MSYGESLLSRIVDSNDSGALTRLDIREEHFHTDPERKAFAFIKQYSEQNRGECPSYATLVEEVEGFTYIPQVGDSYEYLVTKLKDSAGKRMLHDFLTSPDFSNKFSENNTEEFCNGLISELEKIKIGVSQSVRIGTNIKTESNTFLEEYRKRKNGESFKIWRSKFPTINNEVGGGYFSGNCFAWYGRSGRGKSIFAMEEAIEAAFQGANVLVWALEMSKFEWMARAYSSISAREGILTANIDGVDYEAGFENRQLLRGGLSEDFENGFETFLNTLHDVIPGNIVIRAVDDENFVKRDLRQLESDIIQTKADIVVVDPIYYLEQERNDSRVAGGDIAATSKKLRHIAGRTSTVIHVITQAEETKGDRDEEGNRELKAPVRAELKKSKAILEDAALCIGIDTKDGRGVIELSKGRQGGEGAVAEVIYLPNVGIVREMETGAAAASQFNSVF
jgi:replicative DNA helicase